MGCEGWICSASVNQKTPVLPLVLHPHTKLLQRTAVHMVFKTHMEKAEIFVRNLQDLQILAKIPSENNKLTYSGNYLFHYICQYIPLHHRWWPWMIQNLQLPEQNQEEVSDHIQLKSTDGPSLCNEQMQCKSCKFHPGKQGPVSVLQTCLLVATVPS